MTRSWCTSGITVMLIIPAPLAAAKPAIHTPAVGSAERIAIVKTLHAGDNSPHSRFTFRQFRVRQVGPRAIAYVQGEGPVGNFQALLRRDGKASWREIWGEGDGGSNSCRTGARHYSWALRLLRTYTGSPDTVFPGIIARTDELKRMAKADPETHCVGDVNGGPR